MTCILHILLFETTRIYTSSNYSLFSILAAKILSATLRSFCDSLLLVLNITLPNLPSRVVSCKQ